ncbi:MAG: serine--tRNA ligase [Deltaproteobacteria bacterium]|nr:serine--tRNA ligase [Deltaproteobacteria bacterium]
MLDFRQVGQDLDAYRKALGRRPSFDERRLDEVRRLYEARSDAIQEVQALQEKKNAENEAMQKVFRAGTPEEKAKAREEQKALSNRIRAQEERVAELETGLEALMLDIPNVPHESVPVGDESKNEVVRVFGEKPTFDFAARDHVDLGVGLGMLDFEKAAKIAGARFAVEYDDLARMERALAAFMLDTHVEENGYREVAVPFLVNSGALRGTGQLPKFEEEQFRVPFSENVDYWLVPTAEVPVTNLFANDIIGPDDGPLPLAFCAHTACFRKEAGAAGKDTRGLIRMHQFNKVELVRFVEPESSYEELERLVGHAERILQKLELHYRVVLLASGDMSANAAKCYDLEVWLPGQNLYREISSCSNFEDFQARRAKIRYRRGAKDKPRLVHTLNGSGLAVGRTLVAILEQCQEADGGIRIPSALRPYLGGRVRIAPRGRTSS